jgi:hypothetical protein
VIVNGGSDPGLRGSRMAAPPETLSSRLGAGPERLTPQKEGSVMTESDKRIDALADRAKAAANNVHAAQAKTREKLEAQVSEARAAAEKTTEKLDAQAAESRDAASEGWSEIQQGWRNHIAKVRAKVAADMHEFDVDDANMRARLAEEDALMAIDFAYMAVEDAEWAALDAKLARMEADELAATPA